MDGFGAPGFVGPAGSREELHEAFDDPVAQTAVGIGVALLAAQVATRVFGRGGLLNANRYLRIGIGRHGGDKVFRVAGRVIEFFKPDSPHINLWRIGPWGR